jgi:hypothetical protein
MSLRCVDVLVLCFAHARNPRNYAPLKQFEAFMCTHKHYALASLRKHDETRSGKFHASACRHHNS